MAPAMRIFRHGTSEDRYLNPVNSNAMSRDASVRNDTMVLHSLHFGELNDHVVTDRFGNDIASS